ncbi:MAG: hypothetical protein KF881_01385 [Acidobacteria bacterium]|nr:hypothetical protein [Acidobacteriota bacterium]
MQTNLETLIDAVKLLPPDDRKKLTDILIDEAQKTVEAKHRITEVRGLGKGLWKDVDAQDYVDSERDSWEN